MESCEDDGGCAGHGSCEQNVCSCDIGWSASDCSSNNASDWGAFWQLFRIVFAIAFFSISAYAFKHLIKGMTIRRSLGCRLIVLRLFRSPKNLSMLLIASATGLRGFWLAVDPLTFSGLMSHFSERMLYNIVFPLMYSVYCSILLVWYLPSRSGLYQSVAKEKKLWSKIYRNSIVVMMGVSFSIGIGLSACQGLRITSQLFIVIAFFGVCFLMLFILAGLMAFGVLLSKLVRKSDDESEKEQSFPLSRPPSEYIPKTDDTDTEAQANQPFQGRSVYRTSSVMQPRSDFCNCRAGTIRLLHSLPTSEDELRTPPSESWSDSSLSVVAPGASSSFIWSELNSLILSQKYPKRIPTQLIEVQKKRDDYVVILTGQDKIILRQIIVLSLLSVIIGILVVGLAVLHTKITVLKRQDNTLGILYVISAMEVFAHVSVRPIQVLLIFVTEIKVKSKENLQFVSEVCTMQIALRIARNPGNCVLPQNLEAISRRLQKYACPVVDT